MSSFPPTAGGAAKPVRPNPRFNRFDKIKLNAICAEDGTIALWVDILTGNIHISPGGFIDFDDQVGTSIGQMTLDMFSFWGAPPTIQPTSHGNITAGPAYTA